jgi:phosphoglycolate phosphatase-like HAD superfamily hydrolase
VTRVAAIVLDLDGVLLESEGIKTEVFREVFARHPAHAAEMAAYHAAHPSLPRRRKFERLAELLGRAGDTALVDGLVAAFSERVLERMADAPFVRGAEAFLDEFGRRLPLYVASVTPQPDLDEIVIRRGIAERSVRAFGDPPTPKAEAVRAVIREHGGDPRGVVLVGDAPADLDVARQTGVAFLGRDSGIPFPPPRPELHRDMFGVASAIRGLLASTAGR